MKTRQKNMCSLWAKIFFMVLALFMMVRSGWAYNHDLSMTPAADFSSTNAADKKSPDLKIGSDFGSTSTIPDIVRRGVPNDIYARFNINGMLDHTVVSGSMEINFYWRSAASSIETPPVLSHTSWSHIGSLTVTFIPADGPFAGGRVWPADFPSVTTRSVSWTPPATGDYFHVAAKVEYLPAAGITDGYPDDNVAISLYGSQSGLLDIVLLHDVSGSMNYPYSGSTYMQHAISKASFFISSMDESNRLAVVAFSSKYFGGHEDVWANPPLAPPVIQPATSANKSAAATAIAGLTASGATPIGQGLERAIQILTTAPGPARKRVIFLLSDGYENWGTPRACGGSSPTAPCLSGSILSQLQANNIRVFTIALGPYAWTDCLECLANESDGQWYATYFPGIDLADVYLDIQQASYADDLYRKDRGVTGVGDDTYSIYFEGMDNVLYFMLAWEDLKAELNLKLYPPRGRLGPTKVFKGAGYLVIRVKNPRRGNWRYKITGEERKKYLAAVRSNRVGIRLGMNVETIRVVGGAIEIQARLANGRRPVTNARLMATVQVPIGPSLATTVQQAYRKHILKYGTSPVDQNVLKRNPDLTPLAVFIQKIASTKQEPIVKTRKVNVVLRHIGKGIYKGVLSERYTTTAGKYNVTVNALGRAYQRNFSRQVRLQPGDIDYKRSFGEILKIRTTDKRSVWLMRINTVDRFGNAITCPELIERIKTKVKGASLFRKPAIAFGAIQRKLTVSPEHKPVFDVLTIDGKKVKILKTEVNR